MEAELASKRNLVLARKRSAAVRARTTEELREYMRSVVNLEPIIKKAEEQASDGDKDARAFLFERIYGKAPQDIHTTASVEHHYSGQVNVAVLAATVAQQLKDAKLE